MSPHREAYATSGIAPKKRAHPDIGPAFYSVAIAPKVRAFPDIGALHHCTITPQMRAHPNIGPTSISNFNGLASAAEAGACKKCRVTGKYYGSEAPSFTGTAPRLSAWCFVSKQRLHPPPYCRHHHRFEHRRLTRSGNRERDRDREITPPTQRTA